MYPIQLSTAVTSVVGCFISFSIAQQIGLLFLYVYSFTATSFILRVLTSFSILTSSHCCGFAMFLLGVGSVSMFAWSNYQIWAGLGPYVFHLLTAVSSVHSLAPKAVTNWQEAINTLIIPRNKTLLIYCLSCFV